MKKVFAATLFAAAALVAATVLLSACSRSANVATGTAGPAAAELSFSFTRQSGAASNQFAVWIEDSQGSYIKTLYATRYTASGGWKVRETSIPQWVRRSGLAGLDKAHIDALTGATPRNGDLTYAWDGTDSRNAAVPPGDYTIRLEGTLRWEAQVLYSAPVALGQGPATPLVSVEYTGTPPADERDMIGDVAVKVLR